MGEAAMKYPFANGLHFSQLRPTKEWSGTELQQTQGQAERYMAGQESKPKTLLPMVLALPGNWPSPFQKDPVPQSEEVLQSRKHVSHILF